jgi:hypothetical protein
MHQFFSILLERLHNDLFLKYFYLELTCISSGANKLASETLIGATSSTEIVGIFETTLSSG